MCPFIPGLLFSPHYNLQQPSFLSKIYPTTTFTFSSELQLQNTLSISLFQLVETVMSYRLSAKVTQPPASKGENSSNIQHLALEELVSVTVWDGAVKKPSRAQIQDRK